jgi:hypothetical protein
LGTVTRPLPPGKKVRRYRTLDHDNPAVARPNDALALRRAGPMSRRATRCQRSGDPLGE